MTALGRAAISHAYPERSRVWKAMATNVLIMRVAFKAEHVCRTGDFQKPIAACCGGLADFVRCLDEAGVSVDANATARALHSGRLRLLSLQSLYVNSHPLGMWM